MRCFGQFLFSFGCGCKILMRRQKLDLFFIPLLFGFYFMLCLHLLVQQAAKKFIPAGTEIKQIGIAQNFFGKRVPIVANV